MSREREKREPSATPALSHSHSCSQSLFLARGARWEIGGRREPNRRILLAGDEAGTERTLESVVALRLEQVVCEQSELLACANDVRPGRQRARGRRAPGTASKLDAVWRLDAPAIDDAVDRERFRGDRGRRGEAVNDDAMEREEF